MSDNNMPDLGSLMNMAQQLQGDMTKIQEDLARTECKGTAGGGMVTATVNGQYDLVADSPLTGIEHFDAGCARLGRFGELRPGVFAVAVQAQAPAHDQDAAITHAVDVLIGNRVGQGDRRIGRVRHARAAGTQLPAQQNPFGRELDIVVVGKAELPVEVDAIERRRTDVENDVDAFSDGDYVTGLRNRPA